MTTAADALDEIARSAVLEEAGVYGTGMPDYLSRLSTELSSLDGASPLPSPDGTARRARQELACAGQGDG